jgi:hypothetical protein
MLALPNIHVNEFETWLFSGFAVLSAVLVVLRMLRQEFRRETCLFCNQRCKHEEYARHLEGHMIIALSTGALILKNTVNSAKATSSLFQS